mmetsp:Transcript_747/g.1579  ORF Transcript_747/g.1579 Transcript_747/m.1579 type:complete len:384 (-) Transcript_747:21-1172(-)
MGRVDKVSLALAVLLCILASWEGRCALAQSSPSESPGTCRSTAGTSSVANKSLRVYAYEHDIDENIQIKDVTGVFHFSGLLRGGPHYVRDSAAGLERHLFREGLRWHIADDPTLDRVRAYFDTISTSDYPPGFHEKEDIVETRKPWQGWDGQAWVPTKIAMKPATLVTCGSVVKLQGAESKLRLHGFPSMRLSTSGFNPVAAYAHFLVETKSAAGSERADSYWRIAGGIDVDQWVANGYTTCGNESRGVAITNNTIVRLQHVASGKWLHSGWHEGHMFKSVLSKQQEVSLSGDGLKDFDSGDNWILSFSSDLPGLWTADTAVQLRHMNTQCYLRLNQEHRYPHRNGELSGQRDICCGEMDAARTRWESAEGVYIPPPGHDEDL